MVIDNTLCQLGRFLDRWAGDVASVRSVTVSDDAGLGASESITAEVTLEMPIVASGGGGDRIVGCTPSVGEDTLALEFETGLSVPGDVAADEVDFEPVDATLHTDGTATVTVRLTLSGLDQTDESLFVDEQPEQIECLSGGRGDVPSGIEHEESRGERERGSYEGTGESDDEREGEPREGSRDSGDESGGEDVPPFRNPELLQEVYDTHDTFAEMADALEMDVTGETVRRYMIDHDIHQPNSYRADSGAASPATPTATESDDRADLAVRPDGIGLPDGVTVEELIETVSQSNTIYEVKEDLGLERMEAHTMLKDLNMVDLVLGRLSNDTSRDITREDVVERLREVSQAKPH